MGSGISAGTRDVNGNNSDKPGDSISQPETCFSASTLSFQASFPTPVSSGDTALLLPTDSMSELNEKPTELSVERNCWKKGFPSRCHLPSTLARTKKARIGSKNWSDQTCQHQEEW
jgi:hypothetical protein